MQLILGMGINLAKFVGIHSRELFSSAFTTRLEPLGFSFKPLLRSFASSLVQISTIPDIDSLDERGLLSANQIDIFLWYILRLWSKLYVYIYRCLGGVYSGKWIFWNYCLCSGIMDNGCKISQLNKLKDRNDCVFLLTVPVLKTESW